MFADEQVVANLANIYPPFTYFIAILLMPLGLFVALIQSFIFVFLSLVYISEVSHAPHDEHEAHEAQHSHTDRDDETIAAPVPV
jgi:F-type H+-transporting ATPase subunit a